MALGERYNVYAINSQGAGNRVAKIYEEGYTGSVEDLKGGEEPITLDVIPKGDGTPFDPILGSELVVTVRVDSAEALEDFGLAVQKKYYCILYNSTAGANEWQGWNLPEEYEQPHTQGPHDVTLRFTCGLGLLASYDFLNSGSYWRGRQTAITILANLMSNIIPDTSLAPDMYVSISLIPTGGSTAVSSSTLAQAYINRDKYINDDGSVWNCLDVLIDILKTFGARIVMGSNGWYIIRIRDFAYYADGKDLRWTRYSYAGTYEAYGYLSESSRIINHTGINVLGRDVDTWWITGAVMRFERAVKKILVTFDHLYKNILMGGSMNEPVYRGYGPTSWSFWSAGASGGGYSGFIQSPDEDDKTVAYCRVNQYYGSPSVSYLYQTIEDIDTGTDQNLVLSAEVMLEGDENVTGAIVYMKAYLDAASGSSNDRWGRNTGAWNNSDGYISFTISAKAGQWVTISVELDDIPYAGDLSIYLYNPYSSDVGVTGCRWRNVKLLGLYDFEAPTKLTSEALDVSDDNLESMEEIVVTAGDVELSGNENRFFKGSISRNVSGTNTTTTWRSYYYNAGSMAAYGPQQTLLKYLRDNYVIQKGITTRRIRGTMNLDSRLLPTSIYEEDGRYYFFLSWSQNFRSNLLRCQVLELPPIEEEIFETNLIANWSNYLATWDTFTITADPLIDALAEGAGTNAEAVADVIESLIPYESFRVRASGTFTGGSPRLTIGSSTVDLVDGTDEIITPRTTAGNNAVSLQDNQAGAVSHSNILITVTRIYGF